MCYEQRYDCEHNGKGEDIPEALAWMIPFIWTDGMGSASVHKIEMIIVHEWRLKYSRRDLHSISCHSPFSYNQMASWLPSGYSRAFGR